MKLETLVNSPILKNRSIKTDLLEDLVRKLSLDEVAVIIRLQMLTRLRDHAQHR